ncbi:MAG: site-specific DNA-methyltransferase, partial [Pseudomonadota bacterium]
YPGGGHIRDRHEWIITGTKPGKIAIPRDALITLNNGRPASPWLSKDKFLELTQSIWGIPSTSAGRRDHPCPFPLALPENIIRFNGWPGCTVIDPYCGSGTTGMAAVKLGCHAVLIDTSEKYCDIARKRCDAALTARNAPRQAGLFGEAS